MTLSSSFSRQNCHENIQRIESNRTTKITNLLTKTNQKKTNRIHYDRNSGYSNVGYVNPMKGKIIFAIKTQKRKKKHKKEIKSFVCIPILVECEFHSLF